MAYVRGSPQPPILLMLGDATQYLILRTVPIVKDGKPYIEYWLSPFDWTMEMIGLTNDDLDFSIFAQGVIKRTYPRWLVHQTAYNPEKPLFVAFCDFNSIKVRFNSKELGFVSALLDEVESLEEQVKLKELEVRRLRKENGMLALKSREFHETMRGLTESKAIMPVSAESGGEVEFSQKVKGGER